VTGAAGTGGTGDTGDTGDTGGHSVLVVPVPALEEYVRARTAHYDASFVSADPAWVHAHLTVLVDRGEVLLDVRARGRSVDERRLPSERVEAQRELSGEPVHAAESGRGRGPRHAGLCHRDEGRLYRRPK